MSQTMRIDFVSDISCPWCVIGLSALEKAIDAASQRGKAMGDELGKS